jgi:hypothetical protein
METTLDNPVQPPELTDERLTQMRAHLVDEADRDARKRERRTRRRSRATGRRRLVVVTAAVLAAMYAVPAVAEERWWWVQSPDEPMQPATQVLDVGRWRTEELMIDPTDGPVPTASFARDGDRWIVQAFVNKEGSLCVGISPDPPKPANEGASIGCGYPVHGIPLNYTPKEVHWVGFGAFIPGKVTSRAPKFMFGPAAENVRTVDLEDDLKKRVLRVRTIPLPNDLDVPARLWIVVIPVDHLVHTVVPRDGDGKALEHWRLPIAQ